MRLFALVVLMLAGCVSAGTPIDPAKLATLERGRTTLTEAQAALGPPNGVSVLSDGSRVLVYTYVHAQARPETFIPYIGAFIGGADTQSQSVALIFGPDGLLRSGSSHGTQVGASMGLAAERSVTVAPQPIGMPPVLRPAVAPVASPAQLPSTAHRRELLVHAMPVTAETATALRLSPPRGVVVLTVDPAGAGATAGIQAGDVILTFNGTPISTVADIQRALDNVTAGNTVVASIWRSGMELPVAITF